MCLARHLRHPTPVFPAQCALAAAAGLLGHRGGVNVDRVRIVAAEQDSGCRSKRREEVSINTLFRTMRGDQCSNPTTGRQGAHLLLRLVLEGIASYALKRSLHVDILLG